MKYQQPNILKKMLFCLILLFLGLASASVTHAENYTFVTEWGFQGKSEGQFLYPCGVAVDSSGTYIYVADQQNHRIQKFDSSGNFITKWGIKGTGNGEFDNPFDVAVDPSGNVYVADAYNNRIQKFDSNGNFITKWGSRGSNDGQFYNPRGVAVDSSGTYVYVADLFNHRIQQFDSDGNYLTKWGSQGSEEGLLNYPYAAAVDPLSGTVDPSGNNVYVVDNNNHRIQVFSSDGYCLTQWGSSGNSSGQFSNPHGIAFDPLGIYVYVADTDNHRIQKFSSVGAYITQWGSSGNSSGQFNRPFDVTVDSSGNVYVADTSNHRIQKFVLEKITPTITWNNPADIVYGTPLNNTQLNAQAPVFAGTLVYTPPAGTVLNAGTHTLHVDFIPTDTTHENTASKDVIINVLKATPTVTWNNPTNIVYGTELSSTQLNTKASVPGTFVYTPRAGTVLHAGTHTLHVDFTPTDTTNYTTTSKNVTINVMPAETYMFVTKWGSNGTENGQFDRPIGIAVDPKDNIYVADTYNHRIQKFDSNGNYITKWGFKGDGNGQFNNSVDLAVDSSGNVYVADGWNHRIQKFDSNGNFITKWGSFGYRNGTFNYPNDVSIDPFGNVYVADSGNNRIQKFSSSGTFITKWGSRGLGNGQFQDSSGVAVDSSGNVYVADRWNYRIQKFDSNGNYLTQWGSKGDRNGTFNNPADVAVDSSGNVYVADCLNNRTQKFDSNGNYITKWGSPGSSDGQFNYSANVVVDSSGNVYVVDFYNCRIQKFGLGKITPLITWNNPANITYGTAFSNTQLNATASVPGTFKYTPAEGTVLSAGTHTLHVDFTPTDSANYTAVSKNVTINVLKATPTITWNNPADIIYGMPLSSIELNAKASVPGTFIYNPPEGTVLNVGTQILHVDFTPTDAANYSMASKNTTINVLEKKVVKTYNVVATNYQYWSNEQYPLINLFGENYVPLFTYNEPIWKCHVNKLAKPVLDSDEEYTLTIGEQVDLGSGYTLEVKQIDVDGEKVWLEFVKDGQYVDDKLISVGEGGSTWNVELDDIQDEDNILVLRVHVNQVFQGAVDSVAQINGIWLIDYKNAKTIQIEDQIGESILIQIINGVDSSNLGALVFETIEGPIYE